MEPDSSWTSRPEVVAARERMVRSTWAWRANAPADGSDAPLDPHQQILRSEALFAQRLYEAAAAAAQATGD